MDTIFALSSGAPPSGVAIIRVSGRKSRFAVETMCGGVPDARHASLRTIRYPGRGEVIDQGICLWFPGPESFTGEDCAEFHVHGGPAVVRAMLAALGTLEGLRLAEAGEFSRRAFENGRLDLTEVEGLADLIRAETEAQRRQAVGQAAGKLREQIEGWRERIVRMRALVEADFDFADEDDVPDDASATVWAEADYLAAAIREFLDDGRCGEIVRDGFQIVLMGKPNAGKSSLMNALAGRDVAIVTEEAGTTRDLIEVRLDIGGYAVTVVDTAGIREATGAIEREGIRRAEERAKEADLIVWLSAVEDGDRPDVPAAPGVPRLLLRSKDDAGRFGTDGVSVKRLDGLDRLLQAISEKVSAAVRTTEFAVVTRERHRQCLAQCAALLERAAGERDMATELRAELLREAGDWIGKITGRIDVDDMLDVIFREFCIGK